MISFWPIAAEKEALLRASGPALRWGAAAAGKEEGKRGGGAPSRAAPPLLPRRPGLKGAARAAAPTHAGRAGPGGRGGTAAAAPHLKGSQRLLRGWGLCVGPRSAEDGRVFLLSPALWGCVKAAFCFFSSESRLGAQGGMPTAPYRLRELPVIRLSQAAAQLP